MRTALALMLAVVLLSGCAAPTGPAAPPAGSSAAPPAPAQGAADEFRDAPRAAAVVEGDVQRLSVDVSQGFFDPTVIEVRAGVPIELTFGQGQGCLAAVRFPFADIEQDLTAGGATVRLPALEAGEYRFSCGMDMVFGQIVAR